MKKSVIGIALVLIFVIPFVTSVTIVDTKISIKTYPNYDVQVTPFVWDNGGAFAALEKFREDSDEYGDAEFTLSSGVEEFNLAIFIKNQDGKKVIEKRLNGYPAGEDVYLELALDGYIFKYRPEGEEPVSTNTNTTTNSTTNSTTNETTQNTESTDEEPEDTESEEPKTEDTKPNEESGTTGRSIFEEGGFLSKQRLYYVIGALAVAIVIFVGVKLKKSYKLVKRTNVTPEITA